MRSWAGQVELEIVKGWLMGTKIELGGLSSSVLEHRRVATVDHNLLYTLNTYK